MVLTLVKELLSQKAQTHFLLFMSVRLVVFFQMPLYYLELR